MKNSDFINVGIEFYINENGNQIEYICIEILKNYARNQIYGYKCLQYKNSEVKEVSYGIELIDKSEIEFKKTNFCSANELYDKINNFTNKSCDLLGFSLECDKQYYDDIEENIIMETLYLEKENKVMEIIFYKNLYNIYLETNQNFPLIHIEIFDNINNTKYKKLNNYEDSNYLYRMYNLNKTVRVYKMTQGDILTKIKNIYNLDDMKLKGHPCGISIGNMMICFVDTKEDYYDIGNGLLYDKYNLISNDGYKLKSRTI